MCPDDILWWADLLKREPFISAARTIRVYRQRKWRIRVTWMKQTIRVEGKAPENVAVRVRKKSLVHHK